MQTLNQYYKHSKLSTVKLCYFLRLFALDSTASAWLTCLSVRSVNYIFLWWRYLCQHCPMPAELRDAVDLDESYFGPRRVRGKRGRGASDKTIVFGLFNGGGQVYTEVVPGCLKRPGW